MLFTFIQGQTRALGMTWVVCLVCCGVMLWWSYAKPLSHNTGLINDTNFLSTVFSDFSTVQNLFVQ